MLDDALQDEVAGFLRQAASVYAAQAPAPGAALEQLFAAGLPRAANPIPSAGSSLGPTAPNRRFPMLRARIATLPGKLAIAAVGLTFATTGLAAANALPTPVQQAAASLGDVVGVDVPATDGTTTPPPDGTTTPPTEGTTTPPPDGTTTPPPDGTTTPPPDGTTTPPPDGTTTPPPDGTTTPPASGSALAPPATTAAQAAHIHDFDQACGNHGHYVSYVAQNGSEPPCAAALRSGSTTPTSTGSAATPAAGPASAAAAPGAGPGRPSKPAEPPAKAAKAAKAAKTATGSKGGGKGQA